MANSATYLNSYRISDPDINNTFIIVAPKGNGGLNGAQYNNVTLSDATSTGSTQPSENANVLGDVTGDVVNNGSNNGSSNYIGVATINGVQCVLLYDPNAQGGKGYFVLTGVTLPVGATGTYTPASASDSSTWWYLAGTGTPAAPSFAVSDNVGAIQTGVASGSATDDTTPTLSGTATAGATININMNGTAAPGGTVYANASGVWSWTPPTALSQGTYSFTTTQIGTNGSVSAASSPYSIIVDTTPPAAPSISGISPDTGSSSVDGLTNSGVVTLSGTAEANSTVTVSDNGTVVGTTTANGSGAWSLAGISLINGNNTLTAKATDAAGNAGPTSGGFVARLDASAPTAPSLTGISPDTGSSSTDGLTNSGVVTLSGTAEANSTVTVSDNGTIVGTTTANGSGAWSLAGISLINGANTLTAKATDAAGNTGTSSSNFVATLDTSAPAAPSISGISPDTGSSSVDGLTNSGVVTLSGTAEANSTVTVSDNGTVVGTATANGSGAWSLAGINLINGANTLTAKATDASGNTGAASGTFVATLDAGAPAAPSLTGISPDTGSSSTDGLTNSGIVSLSGTAEADSTVTVYNNGTIVGTTTVDAGGAWTLAGIDLVNGGNTLTARATDSAGNPGALSAGFTATLDSTPPAAPVIAALTSDVALLPGIVPNGSTTPDNDLTATVSLVNTNAKVGDVIQLFNGSGTGAPVGAAYTLTAPDIAAGSVILQTGPLVDHTTYSLTARLTDPADNQSVASPAYSAFVDTDLLCFLAGTLVMTPEGSRPVETLRRGDLVITAEGHAIPVRWLGRQTVSTRFGDPLRVMPIRIRAGALGDALPERDLWLSPDHAVLVDDILIHAGALVNGLSIVRDDSVAPTIIYYHVELAAHQLILAEGISAETFIDNVDRMAFDNWEEHDAADQESAPITEMDLPRAKSHRQVPRRVRERLLARARELFGPLTEAA